MVLHQQLLKLLTSAILIAKLLNMSSSYLCLVLFLPEFLSEALSSAGEIAKLLDDSDEACADLGWLEPKLEVSCLFFMDPTTTNWMWMLLNVFFLFFFLFFCWYFETTDWQPVDVFFAAGFGVAAVAFGWRTWPRTAGAQEASLCGGALFGRYAIRGGMG